MSLDWKRLRNKLDYLMDRYDCFVVNNVIERQYCYEVIKKVSLNNNNILNDDLDEVSTFIACKDTHTDQVIACLRTTAAIHYSKHLNLRTLFHLDDFAEIVLPEIVIFSSCYILPEYQGSFAKQQILLKAYEYILLNNYVICLVDCEIALFAQYCSLGYKPIDQMYYSETEGYKIPLYLLIHDFDYLHQLHSDFIKIGKKYHFPFNSKGMEWIRHLQTKREFNFSLVNPYIPDQKVLESLIITQGLRSESKQLLFKNAVSVHAKQGPLLSTQKLNNNMIGFVKTGKIGIVVANQTINEIHTNQCFVVTVANHQQQQFELISLDDNTEIVILYKYCIQEMADSRDYILLQQNIANISHAMIPSK